MVLGREPFENNTTIAPSRGPSAHERSSLTLKAMYEHGGVKLCSELKTSTTSINLDYLKPGRKPGKNKD